MQKLIGDEGWGGGGGACFSLLTPSVCGHNINLRASHEVCLTETSKKPRTVPCSDVPFFILLAFRYFMARIERKIHRETGLLSILNLLSHVETSSLA